jgi:hypothetical protein
MRFHANPFQKNRRKHRDRREHSRESGARRRRDCENRRGSAILRAGPSAGSLRRNSAQQSAGRDAAEYAAAEIDAAEAISGRPGADSIGNFFVVVGHRNRREDFPIALAMVVSVTQIRAYE